MSQVENLSKGRTYARAEMEIVPYSGTVLSSSVTIVDPAKNAVTPDPAVEAMLTPYRAQLTALLDGTIGIATDIFPRGNNIERLQEVAIGNLLADAIRIKYSMSCCKPRLISTRKSTVERLERSMRKSGTGIPR